MRIIIFSVCFHHRGNEKSVNRLRIHTITWYKDREQHSLLNNTFLSHQYVVLHSEVWLRGESGIVHPSYIVEVLGVGDFADLPTFQEI